MAHIGIYLNGSGKVLRASINTGSVVSWCQQSLIDELGLKIVPLEKPTKGLSMKGEIQLLGTVTTTVQLKDSHLRLDNFPLMVAKYSQPIPMICLGTDFLFKFHTNFAIDFGKKSFVLNGMDHWFLEVGEEETNSQVPSILQLQEE